MPSQTGPVRARFSRGWAEIGVRFMVLVFRSPDLPITRSSDLARPTPLPWYPTASHVIPDWRRLQGFCLSDYPLLRLPDDPIFFGFLASGQ